MPDVDFLPPWYAGVRRQRAMLRVQTWLTTGLVVAGLAALVVVRGRAMQASAALAATSDDADRATRTVRKLDETIALQQQLVAKQRVLSDVGLGVEASRVVNEIASCAPREVCFDGLELKTDEQVKAPTIADRARASAAGGPVPAFVTRRLLLRVTGVAPTEDAVTTFWTQLVQRPYVEEARIVNTAELEADGRTMRTFEITLSIPLDVPAEKQ